MGKRSAILILTAIAVIAILYLKTLRPATITPIPGVKTATRKFTFFLFHNPKDQDEECRRIYAFADKTEKELSARVTVIRPDIENQNALLKQYSVRILQRRY